MKKFNYALILIMVLMSFCAGYGKDSIAQATVEKFADYPETIVGQKKTDDEVTVTLNHIAFEKKHVVLDYTVEAPNAREE